MDKQQTAKSQPGALDRMLYRLMAELLLVARAQNHQIAYGQFRLAHLRLVDDVITVGCYGYAFCRN